MEHTQEEQEARKRSAVAPPDGRWPRYNKYAAAAAIASLHRPWANDLKIYKALSDCGFSNPERIGQGGQGVVYRTVLENDRRPVAIKLLRKTGEPKRDATVERELRILGMIRDCPQIIKVVGVVADEEKEREGGSLRLRNVKCILYDLVAVRDRRPAAARYSVQRIRFLCRQLLLALHVCHSRGVMHCDVKPGNVLIGKDNVTLIDFGHARLYEPDKRYGHRLGTVGYRAPELLLQYPYLHYAIDMWSAGCWLLEMLLPTLVVLFHGANAVAQVSNLTLRFGSQAFETLSAKYGLNVYRFRATGARTWLQLLDHLRLPRDADREREVVETQGLDLVNRLLEVDPAKRSTVEEALLHPFVSVSGTTSTTTSTAKTNDVPTVDTHAGQIL